MSYPLCNDKKTNDKKDSDGEDESETSDTDDEESNKQTKSESYFLSANIGLSIHMIVYNVQL